jgi:pSer/pThr/pTyr-binding forkhead associated (FHA) protein
VEIGELDVACAQCDAPQDATSFPLPERGVCEAAETIPDGNVGGAAVGRATSEPPEKKVFARFLLSVSLREPYELEPGELVRVGRSRSNEICFPSGHVSRLHAEVTWEEGCWYVGDLGSKNGTYVNEEQVIRRPLRDNDKIRCGHFEFTYRELTREETQALLMGAGAVRTGTETARLSAEDGFTGDLGNIKLVEVVQLVGQNRKSGVMAITPGTSKNRVCELHFRGGRLVHAQYGDEFGEGAALELLQTNTGSFRFRPTDKTGGPTISTPTDILLFQAMSA